MLLAIPVRNNDFLIKGKFLKYIFKERKNDYCFFSIFSRAVVVHFNFRAGSTFPVPVCSVPHGHWVNKAAFNRTSQCNMVDAVRLYASFMLNLLWLKGQRWVCCIKLKFYILKLHIFFILFSVILCLWLFCKSTY